MAKRRETGAVWRGSPFVIVLVAVLIAGTVGTRLRLVDSGYQDLLVVIRRDVPQDDALLQQLQLLLTSASGDLHNATRGRAYFRSVTLLVPETWRRPPPEAGWGQVTWELEEGADVVVGPPSPLHNNTPFVLQPGGCGEPGRLIHLTPAFLLENRPDQGRVFVHEFAHFRWGVFDEYGTPGDPQTPPFFRDDENNIRPTGCVRDIVGLFEDRVTNGTCTLNETSGLPDDNCQFLTDLSDVNTARASLMYITFLPTGDSFCEGGVQDELRQHDPWAPNLQNRMCGRRATWDVIGEHPDFRDVTINPPVPGQNTTPTFRIVQAVQPTPGHACRARVVLVLDTSSSILTAGRRFRLEQTSAQFIRQLPLGAQLAVLTFSKKVEVTVNLTRLTSDAVKNDVLQRLRKGRQYGLGTAIGLAVQQAFQTLHAAGGVGPRDTVVVFTDGKETIPPPLGRALRGLLPSPARIHALAYSREATPKLRLLSQATGGLYFYYSEADLATDLNSAVAQIISALPDCRDGRTVQLAVRAECVEGGGARREGEVHLDRGAGPRLLFSFSATRDHSSVSFRVELRSPSGELFTPASQESKFYEDSNTYSFSIDQAEVGTWRYTLTSSRGPATVMVTAQGRPNSTEDLLSVDSWVSSLEADLNKREYPVLHAFLHQGELPVVSANVTALVRRPSGDVVSLPLLDNGIPPDGRAGDGLYSAYFTQPSDNDRHSVDVLVDVQEGTASLVTLDNQPGAPPPRRPGYPGNVEVPNQRLEPLGRLQRWSSAGAFHVKGYVPLVDNFPPSEVADLRVTSIQRAEAAVTLEWTAVGDDLTQGTASRYELRVGDSFGAMRTNFSAAMLVTPDMLLDGDLDPLPAGSLQRVTVNVSSMATRRAFVFGVRAVDDAGFLSAMGSPAACSLLPPSFPQSLGQPPQFKSVTSSSSGRSAAQSCFPWSCRLLSSAVLAALVAALCLV